MTALETRPYQPTGTASPNGNGHTNGNKPPAVRGARIPPNDTGAEKDLLGAIILSPAALDDIIPILRPGDFYKPAHNHIYGAILSLAAAGEPIDIRTVTDRITRSGILDSCGGHPGLAELIADVPRTKNVERYARIVKGHATRRGLLAVATEISELGHDQTEDLDHIMDRAEQLLYNLGDTTSDTGHAEILAEAVSVWLDGLEGRYDKNDATIKTGLVDLDRMLSGYRPGQLITACGRPGSGKSLFGVQCGLHVADSHRRPVLIVSAEMPNEELVDRVVSAEARVDNQKIRIGDLNDSDWARVSAAVGRFSDAPLFLYDAPAATLASIRAEIRRVTARAGPLALIVVDYLQLLTTAGKAENRQTEVAELSRGLKRIARDMRVPVLALAQVNRNLENRADKRPTLADLRESGAIEADSDVVIGVYRDEMYNPDSADRGTAELIVLKQRSGPTGTVKVAYLAQYGKFSNMARV